MKKETASPDADAKGEVPAEPTDAAAKTGEPQSDPNHEWPSGGGCYVRQADGTLKKEG
jgi:hypothetical protein